MATLDTTIINKFGTMQGWNDITVNLLSRDVEGITALKYDDTVTKENVPGAGMYPVGRSKGNYEATASITLYKEEADAIKSALATGGRLQDILPFDINVQYEKADGSIVKDRIRNCEFTNDGVDVSNGDGTISIEYTLIVSHIEWNVN
ncbi:hypothetical protein Peternella1_45 [Winogradskyella phage Peternella_1]|uniref:Tail tube protein n=1 Tax=Winogradskyella phage Peternella_1 TaxID=2745699 RepID=A0A8E4ZE53_9CAUD|nr:tail protein [Winogradskyella phage Peternella_1]QQV91581.1 hypothetical protein Peternella1_45 [Winogradskyella phage Peternella_1]